MSPYMNSFLSQVLKPIMHLNNPADQKRSMVLELLLFFLVDTLYFFIDSEILVLIYPRWSICHGAELWPGQYVLSNYTFHESFLILPKLEHGPPSLIFLQKEIILNTGLVFLDQLAVLLNWNFPDSLHP